MFAYSELAEDQENIKKLVNFIKKLPKNLYHLEFDTGDNELGEDPENIKMLVKFFKYLHCKSFAFSIIHNDLGSEPDSIHHLIKGIKSLPNSLEKLNLNL